jgi:hypothetical protein
MPAVCVAAASLYAKSLLFVTQAVLLSPTDFLHNPASSWVSRLSKPVRDNGLSDDSSHVFVEHNDLTTVLGTFGTVNAWSTVPRNEWRALPAGIAGVDITLRRSD